MLETRSRKVRHTQEETTRWTSARLAKARANKAKASTARAKAEGSKDSKDNKDRTRARTMRTTRIRMNVGTLESADTTRKTVGARRTPTKVVRKESTKPNATDAHNLDSAKPANSEPEVEICEFDMSYFNVDAVEVRESE